MPKNSNSKIVLVTGASGFLGYAIATQLLEDGYFVRAQARGAKAHRLTRAFGSRYTNVEVVNIHDIYSDDMSPYLKDVYAIVHVAAPTPGEGTPHSNLKLATSGVRHIMEQAVKAGVTRVVGTSSIVTYPDGEYGANDWCPFRMTDVRSDMGIYAVAKTAADKVMAEFHPTIEVTMISPNYVFGPFPKGFEEFVPEPKHASLSTNGFVYRLLRPDNAIWIKAAGYIDIRDVAKAHSLALEAPSGTELKRFPLDAPHHASWKDAIRLIAESRPGLKERLADIDKAPDHGPSYVPQDVRERVEKNIGFRQDEYIRWKDTALDTVDSLIGLEKYWAAKGFEVEVPVDRVW